MWNNPNNTERTRLRVYHACVLSTILYVSDTSTTYASQEKKLNSFHVRILRRKLQIKRLKVPDTEVLERDNMCSLNALLTERRLRWLGHVRRMDAGRIPKDLLYGELVKVHRKTGRPKLRFKNTCKRDLIKCSINPNRWECQAEDHSAWRVAVRLGTMCAEAE